MENISDPSGVDIHDDQQALSRAHGARERWRKPISVAGVVTVVTALPFLPHTQSELLRTWETYGGLGLVIVAVLGRLWCSIYIGGRKNTELCTAGPYSVVRHPLYVFSSLGVLGVLWAAHRPSGAVIGFSAFWIYYASVMREEEVRLARRFRAEFAEYCSRVSRVWPRVDRRRDSDYLMVTLRPINRAFLDVVWFFAAWIAVTIVTT